MKNMLENGEQAEADDGYCGEPKFIDLPNKMLGSDPKQKRLKAIVRSRHESCNCWFKQWNSLKNTYKNDLANHGYLFRAIAVITQISLRNKEPLFPVNYKTHKLWSEERFVVACSFLDYLFKWNNCSLAPVSVKNMEGNSYVYLIIFRRYFIFLLYYIYSSLCFYLLQNILQ